MTASAKFWDKIAKKYAKSPVANQQAYEAKLTKTREYFTPMSEVFEFGCGTGTTALLHAPFVKHIHATDISEGMLEIARERQAEQNIENVTFEQGTLDDLDIADETYNVVLGLNILHLLEDRINALDKIYRILKPGGVFISSTFCGTGMVTLLRFILPIASPFGLLPKTVNFFKQEELEKNLIDAGFTLDHVWRPEGSDGVFIVAKKPA